MSDLLFYDAAFKPDPEPSGMDGVAFYIGGDTPNVWTKEQVDTAVERFKLPIFVRSDPTQANVAVDVHNALAQLAVIGVPKGSLVALDSETSIDPNYVASFYYGMKSADYPIIDYGSISTLFGNHIPDGYYWGADWTDRPHLDAGTDMTQWTARGAYDESTALSTLPFWDTHQAPPPPTSKFPVVQYGDTGLPTRRVQGLLVANFAILTIDGDFGPITEGAVKAEQHTMNLPQSGIVDDKTWASLLGVTEL